MPAGAAGASDPQQEIKLADLLRCNLRTVRAYLLNANLMLNAARQNPESKVHKALSGGNPDVKVWVNTNSGTYHCPGTRWFGKTHEGDYMTQKEAQDKGYHPAANRPCL